jgi:hypothetical protein
MQTPIAAQKKKFRRAARISILALAIFLSSCADDSQRSTEASAITPYNGWSTPYGGGSNNGNSVLGNYGGRLVIYRYEANGSMREISQQFMLTLGTSAMQGQDPNRLYATMNFQSSGEVNASSYTWLDTLSNGVNTTNGGQLYRFRSVASPIQNLTNTPVSVEFQLTYQNGSFIPAQSWIRILDCGLSRGGSCSVLYTGATLADFRKL